MKKPGYGGTGVTVLEELSKEILMRLPLSRLPLSDHSGWTLEQIAQSLGLRGKQSKLLTPSILIRIGCRSYSDGVSIRYTR